MLDRRTLIAATGAALATGPGSRAFATETATIPSSGATIPRVGLGSWITFNVGSDPQLLNDCAAVIAAFAEEGGGMIDSSPMYGSSQDTIGYGLARLDAPGRVFSADKVWTGDGAAGAAQIGTTRRKWGVERFDLLQVHNLVAWRAHLDTLFAMKESGALRHVGVTTSHGRRLDLLEDIMRSQPLDFVQLTYNAQDRWAEERLLPLAQERGIAVIANRPFRRGALIAQARGAELPGWASEIGAESWAQALLKFVISHPAVTVAIPATSRVDHLRENKRAGRGKLPDAALRARIAADFARL